MSQEHKSFQMTGGSTKTSQKIFSAILMILLFVIIINIFIPDNDKNTTTETTQEVTESQAYIISKNYVESILKSPSTADFPLLDYGAVEISEDKFQVNGYVDSQNGFGAMVRSNFTVILSYNGTGPWSNPSNWTLNQMVFDGEVLYQE